MGIQRVKWRKVGGKEGVGYRVTYKDASGTDRTKQFPKKREAEAFAKDQVPLIQKRMALPTKSPVISDAADFWLDICERVGRRGNQPVVAHTLRAYKSQVDHHIKPEFGSWRLDEVTPPLANQIRNSLLRKLSRPMAKKVVTSLSAIFDEARSHGHVAVNPFDNVTVSVRAGRHQEKIVIPTKAEVKAIRAYLDTKASGNNRWVAKAWRRWRLLINLAIFTGLRSSELRGLARSAVFLDDCRLLVEKAADEKGIVGPCKSASAYRTLVFPDFIPQWLHEARLEWPGQLVFGTAGGKPVNHSNILNRCWYPMQVELGLVDDAGKPRYDFHSLRHFNASLRIAQGAREKELQVEMGHDDPAFTLRVYGHLFEDHEDRQRVRADTMADGL
jgi:integrase